MLFFVKVQDGLFGYMRIAKIGGVFENDAVFLLELRMGLGLGAIGGGI